MGADEVGTLKGLTERRAILDGFIGEHRGRIANTAGDSVLAEFQAMQQFYLTQLGRLERLIGEFCEAPLRKSESDQRRADGGAGKTPVV